MDHLQRRGLPAGTRVMEIGCGWGLLGIYCAKKYGARVISVDVDPEVFPFLRLHAKVNEVEISTMKKGFDGLRTNHLQQIDVLIGADICFWDTMVRPLKNLILRALRAGVQQVLISDPGRSPFEEDVRPLATAGRASRLNARKGHLNGTEVLITADKPPPPLQRRYSRCAIVHERVADKLTRLGQAPNQIPQIALLPAVKGCDVVQAAWNPTQDVFLLLRGLPENQDRLPAALHFLPDPSIQGLIQALLFQMYQV